MTVIAETPMEKVDAVEKVDVAAKAVDPVTAVAVEREVVAGDQVKEDVAEKAVEDLGLRR